jgi:hypothetical protein
MTQRLSNKWGLPRRVYRALAYHHGRVFVPPFNFDDPESCRFGADYWHRYPVRDYDYRYNSWGFRDQDHEQFQDQEVNVCVGDSNTVNVGGPEHHSWPRQLAQYFDIPTLNLGIDDLGCFDVPAVVERARSTYRVRHVFVLYNLQTDDQEAVKQPIPVYNHNHHIQHKISAFQRYALVQGAVFQFDPPWTFGDDDRQTLYRTFPNAHAYLRGALQDYSRVRLDDLISNTALLEKYLDLSGADWPRYPEFCQRVLAGHDMVREFSLDTDQRLVHEYLTRDVAPVIQRLVLANRDGWHLSEYANGLLARYFYQETLTRK